MDVRESYDAAAEAYAEHLSAELVRKPLDRHLLNRFAEAMEGKGLVADLGCGPGHVTAYLRVRGVDAVGLDLSPDMVRVATARNPGIPYRVGDMRQLDVADATLAGIVALYSIVHFLPSELEVVFAEMRRTLVPGGLALLGFHAGEGTVHVEDLFGARVCLDFHYHEPGVILQALQAAHLSVIEHIEREPYADAEYPSRRCYLLARAA